MNRLFGIIAAVAASSLALSIGCAPQGGGDGGGGGADPFYIIGDIGPAGGIVFYVDGTGEHGLEAAPVDQDDGSGAVWGCDGFDALGADGTSIGTGAQNTADILASCEAGTAAELASNYSLNGYDDWFLPSKSEINALYNAKDVVWGLDSGYYWSSSEGNFGFAWHKIFDDGGQNWYAKFNTLRVRAIRAF